MTLFIVIIIYHYKFIQNIITSYWLYSHSINFETLKSIRNNHILKHYIISFSISARPRTKNFQYSKSITFRFMVEISFRIKVTTNSKISFILFSHQIMDINGFWLCNNSYRLWIYKLNSKCWVLFIISSTYR